ncbi:hypothetical protein [Algoriphagus sp. AK58]|uniref:hypothetical protein n=1 Tax=Algoriphagus sp. AK58 TaxID=1406877 RepID=UPI00164F1DFA|nr:hypothetical protein [Algoriphagus sp. AK58]MBC6368665.1 hypothetical protein [Algoriphagus sp. AK58]
MNRLSVLFFLLIGFSISLKAQEEEKKLIAQPSAQFRTFWMNTSYPGEEFKSDYALGMSLGVGGKLTFAKHWDMQLVYRAFGNVVSSDFWNPDPATGQANRYETGLFDILNPTDRFFGRLETFSFGYSKESFGVKVGRMGLNTDWVNAQDGRLSPTAVEGVQAWFAPHAKWKFSFWGIGRMSIRGSSEWLGIGKTVGIYPQGRTVQGKPGNYFGNTESDWLGIWEIDHQLAGGGKVHFSQTYAQNLFSTYWLSFEKSRKRASGIWTWGIQSGFQQGIGEGGNPEPSLRYKEPEDLNYAISGRLGWKNDHWITHLNFTHVGGKGRWLSPREWGKDAWYTFIPRERNEGFESVNALVGYGEYRLENIPVQIYAHAGLHWLSEMSNAAANKYNFPSYRQVNLGLKYQPKTVKNLDIHLLLVSKEPLLSENLTPNQIYNKVEMLHFNAILNWRLN